MRFRDLHIAFACAAAGLALASVAASAQVIRQSSWSIQDPTEGLRQDLAQKIISRADEWLTRDDPDAPVARLDDRVRIVVIEEMDPLTGTIRPRLSQIVLGSVVLDSGFEEFLDEATIASLIRRDHYWRDESVIDFAGGIDPSDIRIDAPLPQRRLSASAASAPRYFLSLSEVSIAIALDARAFVVAGFDELGMPGNSFGRLRAGASSHGVSLWGELPLPFGTSVTPLLPRTLEGSLGTGLSFETESFTGALSWVDPARSIGSRARDSQNYVMAHAALFTWRFPLGDVFGTSGFSLRAGGAYEEFVPVNRRDDRGQSSISVPKLVLRLDYSGTEWPGAGDMQASMGFIGGSVVAAWTEQVTRTFGFRVSAVVNGVLGNRPDYLPTYSILLTPTVSIW